jgi:DNA-3-methyladenine glycosylase II
MWVRRPGFATIIRIVLEQQVSLASAKAAYERLLRVVDRVTAKQLVGVTTAQLRRHGITRQKATYCLELARVVVRGELNLSHLAHMDDRAVRDALLKVRGIGPWTADIYLLMALRRPDVWPVGDLALAETVRRVRRLRTRPSSERLRRIARGWRPWRAVAARILWHCYLSERRAPLRAN